MWTKYRIWKHILGFPLLLLGWFLMKTSPEVSPQWFIGLGLALCLIIAYVAEEIVWMAKRQGRPCGQCGEKVRMKSFRVAAQCPHCRQPLE